MTMASDIIEYVKANPGCTSGEIIRDMRFGNRANVTNVLRKLARSGELRREVREGARPMYIYYEAIA